LGSEFVAGIADHGVLRHLGDLEHCLGAPTSRQQQRRRNQICYYIFTASYNGTTATPTA
jgi:hypothetical protein